GWATFWRRSASRASTRDALARLADARAAGPAGQSFLGSVRSFGQRLWVLVPIHHGVPCGSQYAAHPRPQVRRKPARSAPKCRHATEFWPSVSSQAPVPRHPRSSTEEAAGMAAVVRTGPVREARVRAARLRAARLVAAAAGPKAPAAPAAAGPVVRAAVGPMALAAP